MTNRWALYLDIEVFGSKWNQTDMLAFRGINTLMQAIHAIASKHFTDPPNRLFAHQFGDAFLVVSDFHEDSLDRAALVGVAILRHLLLAGEAAKCALDEGELGDVANCYPDPIRKGYNDGRIEMGSGLMTVTPVMGSALIRTVSIQKLARGPLFLLRSELASRLSPDFLVTPVSSEVASLNWIKGEPMGMDALQEASGLPATNEQQRAGLLRRYLDENVGVSDVWRDNASRHLLAHVA